MRISYPKLLFSAALALFLIVLFVNIRLSQEGKPPSYASTLREAGIRDALSSLFSLDQIKKNQSGDDVTIVELDIPDYLPEQLKHPKHFFSGRPLRIKRKDEFATFEAQLDIQNTGRYLILPTKRKDAKDRRSLTFSIPAGLPTGKHTLKLTTDGTSTRIPLSIEGFTPAERSAEPLIPSSAATTSVLAESQETSYVAYRNKICRYCDWETVFVGHPADSQKLAYVDLDYFSSTQDGGRTWQTSPVDSQTIYPRSGLHYSGDPKIAVLPDGKFFLVSLFWTILENLVRVGGVLYQGNFDLNGLVASILQDVFVNQPLFLLIDYPKIATNVSGSSVYISGNATFFEPNDIGNGLYISRDGGKTFVKKRLNSQTPAVTSMTVAPDGTLYAVTPGNFLYTGEHYFIRFRSFDPLVFDRIFLSFSSNPSGGVPRISTRSNRQWIGYGGPEIVADTNSSSPHRGRLWLVWASAEQKVSDPAVEYGSYGLNLEIFAAYSDNGGQTWSSKIRVNDDVGIGDQFFPSARVDAGGVLHVAFIDHRNSPDLPLFDVYYATSVDGGGSGGVTFSKNIRITDTSFSVLVGGRVLGDYRDMVVAYNDRTYVAYPCEEDGNTYPYYPVDSCMVEVRPASVSPADLTINGFDGPLTVPFNSTLTLSWCGSPAKPCLNASYCQVQGIGPSYVESWTGLSGTETTAMLAGGSYRYTLTCSSGIATARDEVRVSVNPPAPLPPVQRSKFQYVLSLSKGDNFISSPLIENTPTPLSSLKTTCKNLKASKYDNEKKLYTEAETLTDRESRGYRIATDNNCSITLKGDRQRTKDDFTGMKMRAGLNLIGAPAQPAPFNRVKGNCAVTSGYLYTREGKITMIQTLDPGRGYLVIVKGDCTLGSP